MRLGTRIFCCSLLIFAVCFSYPIHWIRDNLRTRYLESAEDPLVDQANILAAGISAWMEAGRFDAVQLQRIFDAVYERRLDARVYSLEKTAVDMEVYITDASGRVLFHSRDPEAVGRDYSRWRDVVLTLQGQYGARTTRGRADDPGSSVMHVAAPVTLNGDLAGVLTVTKPVTYINIFLHAAKQRITHLGVAAFLVAILLSFLVSTWLTRPILRLTQYARDVSEGRRVPFPRLDRSEIGELGAAFRRMQEALEGKKYVENYVQSLTHEIKSPLSAVSGAAELLEEEMPAEQRRRFVANIRTETHRAQRIVERLLELAALENRQALERVEPVAVDALLRTVAESLNPLADVRDLKLVVGAAAGLTVSGDGLLLHQAVSNLLQNAVDFSPSGARVEVTARRRQGQVCVTVRDEGPGIPDFALERIFEKFFSLQRPDGGKKSTGLGLNFVRETALLHGGYVRLENRPAGGVRADLVIPETGLQVET